MRRVVVLGCSGAGKTTLARAIGNALGVPHIELDAMFHQPGWQPLAQELFRARLTERLLQAEAGWVTCGNYGQQLGWLHVRQADTIVWLDLPRIQVLRQVLARSLGRLVTRELLWNGNRESLGKLLRWNSDNVVVWAWTSWPTKRREYEASLSNGTWAHARVHRLASHAQVAAFRSGLPQDGAARQQRPATTQL